MRDIDDSGQADKDGLGTMSQPWDQDCKNYKQSVRPKADLFKSAPDSRTEWVWIGGQFDGVLIVKDLEILP